MKIQPYRRGYKGTIPLYKVETYEELVEIPFIEKWMQLPKFETFKIESFNETKFMLVAIYKNMKLDIAIVSDVGDFKIPECKGI